MFLQKSSCFQLLLLRQLTFYKIEDSDRSAATHLRCGGIFSDIVITNVLLIKTVK